MTRALFSASILSAKGCQRPVELVVLLRRLLLPCARRDWSTRRGLQLGGRVDADLVQHLHEHGSMF